jgi:ribosomal protein S27E
VGGEEGRRRAPELSVLHEAFRRGWPAVSSSVPTRVKREVQRYLECGDVRYGFVEVACEDCKESRLVAFSCKGRGWCPSCTTRRAIDTGAHLASVLPHVGHRQWTLSLPFTVRFTVVKKPQLLKRLEVRLVQAVWRWQRREARRHGVTGPLRGGGVCFWQWFGSSLQLTPHLHLLVPEALWKPDAEGVPLGPPGDDDVALVLHRVLRQAKRDWADEGTAWADDEYEVLQQEAIQQRLPLADTPPRRSRRLAVAEGFSLHADTAVHGHDRQGLERLCRYGARGPVSECRLRRLEDGRYEYTPKKGVTFTLTAEALVRRLVALLPPAKLHLTSFHGVYAPNASLRPLVTRQPDAEVPAPTGPRAVVPPKKKTKRRLDWATLHQRTFGTDVLRCPCGGRRTIRALHSTPKAAEERLPALGITLPSRALPLATAPPQLAFAV